MFTLLAYCKPYWAFLPATSLRSPSTNPFKEVFWMDNIFNDVLEEEILFLKQFPERTLSLFILQPNISFILLQL